MSDAVIVASLACAVLAYAVWAWRSTRVTATDLADARSAYAATHADVNALLDRMKRVENTLRIDNGAAVAAAAKRSVPAFMKGSGEA